MFKALTKIRTGNTEGIPDNMTWPLLRWNSGDENNLEYCSEVNRRYFHLPVKVSKEVLALGLKPGKVPKYPKATKDKNKKIETLTPYLKDLYQISSNGILPLLPLLMNLVEISSFIEEIDAKCGMSNKDLKVFGIKKTKIKPMKVEEKKEVKHNFW